jgi:hypothetical protein
LGGARNYPIGNSGDDNDDNKFPTLEQLLLDIKKKIILVRAKQDISSIGKEVNNRTQDDSPVDYSGSTLSSF